MIAMIPTTDNEIHMQWRYSKGGLCTMGKELSHRLRTTDWCRVTCPDCLRRIDVEKDRRPEMEHSGQV